MVETLSGYMQVLKMMMMVVVMMMMMMLRWE
jgi:hypothetical protein